MSRLRRVAVMSLLGVLVVVGACTGEQDEAAGREEVSDANGSGSDGVSEVEPGQGPSTTSAPGSEPDATTTTAGGRGELSAEVLVGALGDQVDECCEGDADDVGFVAGDVPGRLVRVRLGDEGVGDVAAGLEDPRLHQIDDVGAFVLSEDDGGTTLRFECAESRYTLSAEAGLDTTAGWATSISAATGCSPVGADLTPEQLT